MSLGPIPWTAVRLYAATYDLDADEFDALTQCINRMDTAFLDYHMKQKKG